MLSKEFDFAIHDTLRRAHRVSPTVGETFLHPEAWFVTGVLTPCALRIIDHPRKEEAGIGAERVSVSIDPAEKSFQPVRFACPRCGTTAIVRQSQGDCCPGCGFEFKWFLPHEAESARDYYDVLTGEKYWLELPGGDGWVVAHY